MNGRLVFIAAVLLAGCSQRSVSPAPKAEAKAEPEKIDNAATRYAGGLATDLDRAKKSAAAYGEASQGRAADAESVQ